MFVDMAMLVHAQGEMIDNIELNITDAKNYVAKGVKKLESAQKDHRKARSVKFLKLVN